MIKLHLMQFGKWNSKKYSDFNADNAMEIIRYEVGRVFEQVLEDVGVFKRDKQGKEAFARFVEQLGWFGIYENELLHYV